MFVGQSHDASANPKSGQLNRLSTYYAAELLAKEWMQPTNKAHDIFPVSVSEAALTSILSLARESRTTKSPVASIQRTPRHHASSASMRFDDRTSSGPYSPSTRIPNAQRN